MRESTVRRLRREIAQKERLIKNWEGRLRKAPLLQRLVLHAHIFLARHSITRRRRQIWTLGQRIGKPRPRRARGEGR